MTGRWLGTILFVGGLIAWLPAGYLGIFLLVGAYTPSFVPPYRVDVPLAIAGYLLTTGPFVTALVGAVLLLEGPTRRLCRYIQQALGGAK